MIKNIRLFYYYIPAGLFVLGVLLGSVFITSFNIFTSKNLVFPVIFFAFPLVMLYYIVLAVVKLVVEMRRGKTGTQYQAGILLSFFLIILLIMGPFIFFLNTTLNRSFDIWMMTDLRGALEAGHKLTQSLESENKKKLMAASESIIANLEAGLQPLTEGMEIDYFKLYRDGEPAGFLSKDKDDFNMITTKDIMEYRNSNLLFLRKQFGQRYYLVYLKQARLQEKSYTVITASKINAQIYHSMAAIEKGFIIYQQMNVFQKPYQRLIFMLMVDFILLVLFIAVLLSILFSKRISSPIVKLYEGIQNIATGKLDFIIQYDKKDEMRILISSFNNMIKELSFNQQAVLHSRHMDAWKKIAIRQIAEMKKKILELTAEANQASILMSDPQTGKPDLSGLQSKVQELSRILSEFDTMTESTRVTLRKENLNDIIRDVVELFESANPNISFHVELDNSLPLMNINREEIHQVIMNLVKNGIEAIPPRSKGMIRIVTQHQSVFQGQFVRLEVSDNGMGIPEDTLPRIFDPYFSTKKKKQGLGLTVVKKILNDHEARIGYKRVDGKSIFVIDFQTQ